MNYGLVLVGANAIPKTAFVFKNGQQSELSAEMKIPLRHKNSFRCIVVVNCQHNVKIFSPYQEGERKKSVIFCSDLFMTLA